MKKNENFLKLKKTPNYEAKNTKSVKNNEKLIKNEKK